MTTLSLTAPKNVGTRDLVRTWLESALPDDLEGSMVEVDCGPLRAPTPSFVDELLKILIIERRSPRVRLQNASERAQSIALQSAKNRHIADRVEVEVLTERAGLLHRLRR